MSDVEEAVASRVDALARHWGVEASIDALADALADDASAERVWTFLAAIAAAIPSRRSFQSVMRRVDMDGGRRTALELHRAATWLTGDQSTREIEIVVGAVLVDVHDTVG